MVGNSDGDDDDDAAAADAQVYLPGKQYSSCKAVWACFGLSLSLGSHAARGLKAKHRVSTVHCRGIPIPGCGM